MGNCTSSGGWGGGSAKAMKDAQKNVTNLPALEGSEKQVATANDIRQSAFSTFDTLADKMSRGIDEKNRKIYYPESGDDISLPMDSIKATRKALIKYLSDETKAENIIKYKGAFDYNSISDLVENIRNAKKKAKASGRMSDLSDDMIYKFVKMNIDAYKRGVG